MAGFGAQVDYWGLDSATLSFIESSTTPAPVSVERAVNADGNVAAEDSYAGGPAAAIEVKYRLLSGDLDLSTLALGYLLVTATKTCRTSIKVDTSNGEWPTITISGFTGVTNETLYPTFTLPAITITGKKSAQELDFTTAAGCRLQSSSLTVSGEFHHALDNAGAVGAMAFTGATAEITAEFVEITTVAGWTLGGTWTETQAPGASNANIGWGTASGSATKMLEPDV